MKLKPGHHIVSMTILPEAISSHIENEQEGATSASEGESEDEATSDDEGGSSSAAEQGPWFLFVTANGLGKRVPVNMFTKKGRRGQGVAGIKLGPGDHLVRVQFVGSPGDQVVVATTKGMMTRVQVGKISAVQSRSSKGSKLMRVDDGDEVQSVAVVPAAAAS